MTKTLNSQRVRALAPENDPLKIGMGWTIEDLERPQIMVESTFGDSHPGSAHLMEFVDEVMRGIADEGGRGARYFTTDICDGIAQGHDGINYSLPHRDMIAGMIEIHGRSTGFDGG
ncbi:MAG: dihydroxy-acid dehydratase, partial [Alistipes sp.]|nr:dihydroxy-acid dehydratase [Alistipes sp.]